MKIGDQVLFKDEVGGGVITQLSRGLAFIEEESGFGDWFELSELIHKEEVNIATPSNAEVEIKEKGASRSSKPHSKNHLSRLEVDLHLEAFLDN